MIQSVGSQSSLVAMQMMRKPPEPQEILDKFDSDGDGGLGLEELEAMTADMAEKSGREGPDAEQMMADLDSDGDGVLSFAEFEAGRPQGPPPNLGGPEGGMGGTQPDLASLFGRSEEEDEEVSSLLELLA